mgnify:CR=1 FL=1
MYFGYNDIDAEKNGILMNFEPPEVIAKNRAETELDFKMHSFGIPNNIVEFIKSRDEFGVRLDTRIKCNDVVTPVIIFLQLEKQKEKCEIMTFYFIAKSTYARHETPEIEK